MTPPVRRSRPREARPPPPHDRVICNPRACLKASLRSCDKIPYATLGGIWGDAGQPAPGRGTPIMQPEVARHTALSDTVGPPPHGCRAGSMTPLSNLV